MSKFPSIPDFTNDIESMATTLRAMKLSVDMLTGKTQGQAIGVPTIFVQSFPPTESRFTVLTRNDLWINDDTDVMSYWNGVEWKVLA